MGEEAAECGSWNLEAYLGVEAELCGEESGESVDLGDSLSFGNVMWAVDAVCAATEEDEDEEARFLPTVKTTLRC